MNDSTLPPPQPIAMPTKGGRPAPPQLSAITFRAILRALAPDPTRSAPTDEVRFDEATQALLRGVLARYGFERAPATFGELFGLFEYCDNLDAASGVGMRPADQLAEWQAASFEVWRRKQPALMPAIELFCAGRIDDLRQLHRDDDTLARLGRDYLQPGIEEQQ